MAERIIEKGYRNWPEAQARLRQLREAGFHGQAVDMGEDIHVIVDGGKRSHPLSKLPKRMVSK